MDGETLYKFYKVNVESVNEDDTFKFNKKIFQLIMLKNNNLEELNERYKMAQHLYKNNETNILMPITNIHGEIRTWHENNTYVLLVNLNESTDKIFTGKSLAKFHLRGRRMSDSFEETNRAGKWSELWLRRLEQIEIIWQEKCFNRPQNDFEKLFIEAFPYYLGLTENALQYISDCENEPLFQNGDFITICHSKFRDNLFNDYKNPFDWVYDYPMRDVAELIRGTFFDKPSTFGSDVNTFMQEYLRESPISKKSAKMLISRLLLPLNFFETVEKYFTASSEQVRKSMFEKMEREYKLTAVYENLILNLFDVASIPEMYKMVRIPEWMVKIK